MDEQKQQLIDRINQAQNILVTVSRNPSVDQLSAAIGLTLALNKLDKHGTAVFSGEVPSTIDFLKPEETLEKNTDSLRDFIIALDKSKADKLRYKVEDQVVRIFITPYKTSLSEQDLEFSQGDFNVDVVITLGVSDPQDLDAAITAHGRILHDATVASISTTGQGGVGTINWVDQRSSSLSEMVVYLTDDLDKKILDNQIATALLTGIVASTDRFSNDRTTPRTMSASAALMAAGANQQLIATELEASTAPPTGLRESQAEPSQTAEKPAKNTKNEPGTLEIDHDAASQDELTTEAAGTKSAEEPVQPQIQVDENGQLITSEPLPEISRVRGVAGDGRPTERGRSKSKRERMVEPPKLSDTDLTANTSPEALDPSTEELTKPAVDSPLLTHNETVLPPLADPLAAAPSAPPSFVPPLSEPPQTDPALPLPEPPQPTSGAAPFADDTTLSEIEYSVDSPHLHTDEAAEPALTADPAPDASVDDARSAVEAAFSGGSTPGDPLQPIAALNAQPLGPELHAEQANETPAMPDPFAIPVAAPGSAPVVPNTGFSEPTPGNSPADQTLDMPLPPNPFGAGPQAPQPAPFTLPASPAAPSPFTPPGSPSLPPFDPIASAQPPSTFPGAPQPPVQSAGSGQAPPPVPPPMLPPLQ